MKAPKIRTLVILSSFAVFSLLAIAPSRAQSSGSAGGCCGSNTSNPTSSTSAPVTTCGSGTVAGNGVCSATAPAASGGSTTCPSGQVLINGTCSAPAAH